jgi:hypothetical protein
MNNRPFSHPINILANLNKIPDSPPIRIKSVTQSIDRLCIAIKNRKGVFSELAPVVWTGDGVL